jgi:hypothetical protein
LASPDALGCLRRDKAVECRADFGAQAQIAEARRSLASPHWSADVVIINDKQTLWSLAPRRAATRIAAHRAAAQTSISLGAGQYWQACVTISEMPMSDDW